MDESIGTKYPNRILFGQPAGLGGRSAPSTEPADPAEYSTRKPLSALPSTLQEQLARQHADDTSKTDLALDTLQQYPDEAPLPPGALDDVI